MKLIATPRFLREAKRLYPADKTALDGAVRAIAEDPEIGEMKRGDLAGVRVHKYRHDAQQFLLAYRVVPEADAIKLLSFGAHENFYRDLKRE